MNPTIIITWTAERSYIRIVDPENRVNNWGIISPADGQLSVRPPLRHLLMRAGTYAEKTWSDGPGCHGGVPDYQHSDDFRCPDCAVGYIARSLGKLGYPVLDLRQ